MNLDNLSDYLATYSGRDKVFRLLSYAAKLGSGLSTDEQIATRFQIFSSQISGCRMTFRLLDDASMFNHVLKYGWGKEEPDWILRCINLMQNFIDIAFYPVEHMCWFGGKKIIPVKHLTSLEILSIWCWVVSIYFSLLKCIRRMDQLQKHKTCLKNSKCDIGVAGRVVKDQQRDEFVTCARLMLDLSYAVNYLPPGTLWGNRLKTWHVGALGTISSVIILYQSLSKHMSAKKS